MAPQFIASWEYADSAKLLCTLPDRVISLKMEDGKIIAETEGGWYEILHDGSYIGIRK